MSQNKENARVITLCPVVTIRVQTRPISALSAGVSTWSGFDVTSNPGWIWFAKIKLIVLRATTTRLTPQR